MMSELTKTCNMPVILTEQHRAPILHRLRLSAELQLLLFLLQAHRFSSPHLKAARFGIVAGYLGGRRIRRIQGVFLFFIYILAMTCQSRDFVERPTDNNNNYNYNVEVCSPQDQ